MAHQSQPAAIDTTEDARQRHMLVQEARQMTLRAGHRPAPDAIRREYTPSDPALNTRLDAAGAGESYNARQFGHLGEPDTARQYGPARSTDLSVSTGAGKTVYTLDPATGHFRAIERGDIDV